MNYNQVKKALEFLNDPGSKIVIQVPYERDIELVRRYITDAITPILSKSNRKYLEFPGQRAIYFESLSAKTKQCQAGLRPLPTFMVDRKRDRSYYRKLNIV